MDRTELGNEPLIVFKLYECFWVLYFKFQAFLSYLKRLSLGILKGQASRKCLRGYWLLAALSEGVRECWQPSDKYVTGCQRVLATP
jgi:hypothetical protein